MSAPALATPFRQLPAAPWRWVAGVSSILLLLVLLGAPISTAWAGADRVQLRDDVPTHDVWPAASILTDASRVMSVQDAMARAPEFSAPPRSSGTLGVQTHAVWVRLPIAVSPTSDGIWLLDIDYPVLQRLEVYLTQEGHVSQQATLGSLQPFSQRPLRSRSHALPLIMQPGQHYEVLLRVETTGAMVLPITLAKPPAWHSAAMNEQMLQGMLTGLALCLLIYSLAQWVNLRDVLFIQYALLITGSTLFSLHLFGLGSQYLWRDNAWFELHAAGLSALMATCGSFLFISQALVGDRPQSRLLRAMRGGALLCAMLGVVHALDVLSTAAIAIVVSVLGLVPALMGIPGAVRRARQGDPVGTSLLLAWLIYFAATATVIGVIRGWVPVNFWTLHSFSFGATLDMLLFMRVLGLRTKALRAEAIHANRERDAMRSLAHTDPLTGLPNRRGLNIALASALPRCGPDKLLAVYVMDLDGFKPVNDQHGHDVGDELLVAVTRRLQGHIRQSDVVARLGGDEFVVMTGDLGNALQAQELGLKLLDAFRSPFSLGKVQVEVGLTIGYAIAPEDSNDAVGLLKLADAAMYSGKQGGKFCLRRNTGDLALSSS
ncbi:diguanylate cyclase [Acidovorax sp. sic0104]|uniref:diguanylate cyclase n=1 Tax=Acidovorax sp. sic0104 TaxID=2854784 RepID=UPI001C4370F7|nr:diguanylate cyclase [Acidovorax sp. sic0104]MBV7544482.1 sensor domain-containing diguanylate cyclase [Acidovorax sp. sic0104]